MITSKIFYFSFTLLVITSILFAQNQPMQTKMMKDSTGKNMMMDKDKMMNDDMMMKVNNNEGGIAIKGYDPVAYFEDGEAEMGSDKYSYQWMDAVWHFSSKDHMMMFKKDPDKYAPQYGGHCAFAASEGYYAPVDPEAWTIHNGKLYLNYNSKVSMKFNEDIVTRIMKADMNWKEHKLKEKM